LSELLPERRALEKSQRVRTTAIASVLAVVVVGLLLYFGLRRPPDPQTPGLPPPPPEPVAEEAAEPVVVDLFFPGQDGLLYPDPREMPPAADTEKAVTQVVEALLLGPEDAGLYPLFPTGVTLGRVHVMDGSTVFVDLESADGSPPPPTGSLDELVTVYGLVDSIVLNVEAAERVVLLWNGRQPNTFAGHVDTTRPLFARPELISPSYAPASSTTPF